MVTVSKRQEDGKPFFSYADLTEQEIRESIRQELMKRIPLEHNAHKALSLDERVDRVMECVNVMRDPRASELEKERARKKKYKYFNPVKANLSQNLRRQRRYNEDPEYARMINNKNKKHYMNSEKYREERKLDQERDLGKKRDYVWKKLGDKCTLCGCTDRSLFETHHTDPEVKLCDIRDLIDYKHRDMLDEELKKCIILCKNCHKSITSIQRYLQTCKRRSISPGVIFDILRDYRDGQIPADIARRRGIPDDTIKNILDGHSYKVVTEMAPRLIESLPLHIKQNFDIKPTFEVMDLSQIERPAITPFIPLHSPVFALETPFLLECMRQIQQFNATHNDEKIPIPPIKYAEGITPFNMHEMERTDDDEANVHNVGIPGVQWVTPFDFMN
jgi:hypothetical protein